MSETENTVNNTQPRVRKSTRARRSPSPLLAYLIALFAVAFALLLLSYFRQQRATDQQVISGLQENASAMQTVSTVLERSKALEEENGQLKQQLAELEGERERADSAEKTTLALDWLWRIEREFFRKKNSAAREMIVAFEETGLPEALPETSPTAPDYRSPAEQYRSIYDALF